MMCRKQRTSIRPVLVALALAFSAERTVNGQCAAPPKLAPRKTIEVVETANFCIYGIGPLRGASRIGDDFESLRERLCRTWLGEKRLANWSPKCEVVVHATTSCYLRAVGQDQFATLGASLIDAKNQAISRRRIDICADRAGWFASAAPHELTHIIMADEFLGGQLPTWADEGMAVLADAAPKQSLHLRDFNDGRRDRTVFRLAEFICQKCYPSADRIGVFYGQSMSLVKFLSDRKSPPDFVRFMHRMEKIGCDAALRDIYGLDSVAELERQWLAAVAKTRSPQVAVALAPVARLIPVPPRS